MIVPQLPLALAARHTPGLDDFLPGDAPARAAIAVWSDAARAATDALLLCGPAGSGKTHLLLAGSERLQGQGVEVAYLPLAELGVHAAEVLAAQPVTPALAIDQLDAALEQPALQLALFAAHNRQRDAGARLLYAARGNPLEWHGLLPDLRSRLGQATRFALPLLDEAQRRDWLVARAQRRGIQLDEAALEFLFRRVGRDLPGLERLLDGIDRHSLAAQRRITVPFLRALLARDDAAG